MARRIAVEIVGDASSLERAFKKSSKSAQQFNGDIAKTGKGKKAFGGLAKGAGLLTGALGVGGLAEGAKAAFTEMADAQKVSAQTEAALKSTKGAAKVTAKEMDKLSTTLMQKSGVDDEAIKSSQNLLLTFTKVRNETGKGNDIFNQATGTILDMSTALGQDTKSSAIQLGKALNDPVKGITALSRVGVSFTKGQKKQIEAMVEAGDTMGAQKLILAELNKEFGGSAEAAGNTLPGKLNILKESLLNMGGTIAESLTPQIQETITKMTDWLTQSENQKAVMDTVKGITEALGTAVGILKGAFELLSGAVGGNKNAIKLLIGMYATFKVAQFGGTISKLAGNFSGLTGKMNGSRTAAGKFKGSLAGKAGVAGAVVLAGWELSNLIRKIPGWDKKMKEFGASIYGVATNLGLIKDPMAEFEGKAVPNQAIAKQIRDQAARLKAKGFTPRQAADQIARQRPGMARHDIDVFSGVTARPSGLAIGPGATFNFTGVQNPREMEEQITKRARRRPQRRR